MDDNPRLVFQENLKKLMKEKNKTQTDISRAMDIPLSTVSSWVNGKSYPRVDKMQDLADYLLVSMKDLTDARDNDTVILKDSEIEMIRKFRKLTPEDKVYIMYNIDKLSHPDGYDTRIKAFVDPNCARKYLDDNQLTFSFSGSEISDDDATKLATNIYNKIKSKN